MHKKVATYITDNFADIYIRVTIRWWTFSMMYLVVVNCRLCWTDMTLWNCVHHIVLSF